MNENNLDDVRSSIYGHTFGALEAITGYNEYVHGEAIAIGMTCAARLAEQLGRIDGELLKRQTRLFENVGLPTGMPECDHDEFLRLMSKDKKVEHGQLRLILPTRLGHVELVGDVPSSDILAVCSCAIGPAFIGRPNSSRKRCRFHQSGPRMDHSSCQTVEYCHTKVFHMRREKDYEHFPFDFF